MRHQRDRSARSDRAARATSAPCRVVTLGCRLNAYESEVMRGHAAAAGLERRRDRQHLRRDRRSRAPGAPDHPQARGASSPQRAHHRHRLRRADRARALRRHAGSRPRHRQCREDARRDVSRPAASATARACWSTTSCRVRETARAPDRRLRRRARAPTCRCRTAAIIAAPSASFPTAAGLRARCRPARWWRRCAAWSKPATPRSC